MVCYVKEFRGLAVRGWLPMPCPVLTTHGSYQDSPQGDRPIMAT